MKYIVMLAMLSSLSALASYDYCAVAYNGLDQYSQQLPLRNGDRIRNLNQLGWDNRISAFHVRQGCSVVGYQYQNFNRDLYTNRPINGLIRQYANRYEAGYQFFVIGALSEKISSLECSCNH